MTNVCRRLGVSQRKACKVLGQAHSTQRYKCKQPDKDRPLVKDMACCGIFDPVFIRGYRRIRIKLCEKGWFVGFQRVYRLWRQEGLQIRKKQHKKPHCVGSENACHRKRPEHYNHSPKTMVKSLKLSGRPIYKPKQVRHRPKIA